MMKIMALAFLFSTGLAEITPLTVKSDDVKIGFVVDEDHQGTLSGFDATILFDPADPANSSISGTVDASTINTDNTKRDGHLKSADYLDVATYPTMSFRSTSIAAEGEGFTMTGLMKIKDVEREESIHFTFADNIFTGTSTISLSYYNIGSYAKKKPEQTKISISFLVPVL